jgi:hypothetical protein
VQRGLFVRAGRSWRPGLLLALAGATLAGIPSGPVTSAQVAAAAAAVPLNECASADHGAPVVDSVTLGSTAVDVRRRGASVVVAAVVRDTGGPGEPSGIAGVTVGASSEVRQHWSGVEADMELVSGDLWRGVLRIPRGSAAGSWTVHVGSLDRSGLSLLSFANRYPVSATASLTVRSDEDGRAPVATAVHLRPTVVDVRDAKSRVRVTVDAKDRRAGVREVRVMLEKAGSSIASTPEVYLRRVAGSARQGRWRGHLDLPGGSRRGRWEVGLILADRVGHYREYGSDRALPGRPKPEGLTSLRVRSDRDVVGPTATALTASTPVLDIRSGPATLTIEARVRDAGSGAKNVTGVVQRGLIWEYFVRMRLVAGTRKDGLWRGTWTARTCEVLPGARTIAVDVRDRAFNDSPSASPGPGLDVVNDDHSGPWITGDTVSSTAVTVWFTEDVRGISLQSAYLISGGGEPTDPPVPGAWSCADASGAPVDCLTGPALTATFSPTTPLTHHYGALVLNPEHVLELTDMAGNPYLLGNESVGIWPRV